jgi:23S rRNA (adenine2503-C2)-methyltransferase
VFIPDVGKAGALCVSSQVGCTLTCTFCHTGTQKLVRNLTAAEIVNQVMIARDALGEWPTTRAPAQRWRSPAHQHRLHGHGRAALQSRQCRRGDQTISDGDGISISKRRITVSTAGVAPKIPELGAAYGRDAGDLAARNE